MENTKCIGCTFDHVTNFLNLYAQYSCRLVTIVGVFAPPSQSSKKGICALFISGPKRCLSGPAWTRRGHTLPTLNLEQLGQLFKFSVHSQSLFVPRGPHFSQKKATFKLKKLNSAGRMWPAGRMLSPPSLESVLYVFHFIIYCNFNQSASKLIGTVWFWITDDSNIQHFFPVLVLTFKQNCYYIEGLKIANWIQSYHTLFPNYCY